MLLDGRRKLKGDASIIVESRESCKALGIEEPDCVYVYVPANVFGANSL